MISNWVNASYAEVLVLKFMLKFVLMILQMVTILQVYATDDPDALERNHVE